MPRASVSGVKPDVMSTKKEAREAEAAEDRDLVEKAKTGDRRAFGKLVEKYQRRVYSLAFGILRQREDAWDVAQEAFVKAYKKLDRFEGTAAFYTWLYRITYNLSIDTLREKARRETVDLDGSRKLEEALAESDQPAEAHPDQMAQRKELHRVLQVAMSKLSDKHRAIIVLREVEGLSYEEMAEVLDISKGTVMSRLFHARQNLQTLLEPYVKRGEEVPQSLKLAVQGG
jgi:RNA polymerase sigma-70 factor, ECF subfamily